jgi:hypothetical protein
VSDDEVGAVTLTVGDYNMVIGTRPPGLLGQYLTHAQLVENFPIADDRSSVGYCFVAVGTGDWPQLVVTQRFSPAGHGFAPGLLLVPETATLFIGAGTRLLGYHRDITGEWQTTFVDEADTGFWPGASTATSCSCQQSSSWRRGPPTARNCGARSSNHPGPTNLPATRSTSM